MDAKELLKKAPASAESTVNMPGARPIELADSAVTYLKQVYSLLAASLFLAVVAGYIGMRSPFVFEHLTLMIVLEFGALFLSFYFRNAITLFLFTALSGLTLGPVLASYVNAGLSSVIGQAAFLTGAAFAGLTGYALTTRRDLSVMGGMLFAGLIVIVVGSLINLFMQTSAVTFALSAMGAVIFSGYIVYETQMLKNNPWAVAPSSAALGLYLNILNLFLSLLRLLGMFGGDD